MIETREPVHLFTIKDDDKDTSFHMDIPNESWDIHKDYWYDFCCMYRLSFALKDSGPGLPSQGTNLIPQSLHELP